MAHVRSAILSILVGFGLIGCETDRSASLGLPPPNFSGPTFYSAPNAPTPTYTPSVRTIKPTPKMVTTPVSGPQTWIPTAPPRDWTYIVVHHSATTVGGAKRFDAAHKAKGWDELGYHFVIGNGTDTADGLVEVGGRWPVQKHGAHAKTPDNYYNEHGIGICLVGNFDEQRISQKQMASLVKLIAFLSDRYHIPTSKIVGHKMTGKQTDCPGKFTDITLIRTLVAQQRKVTEVYETSPNPYRELITDAAISR